MNMSTQSTGHALPPAAIVAVIGAGTMGAGIAQVAAAAGHTVLLTDARADAAQAAIDQIRKSLELRVSKGKMQAEDCAGIVSRIHAVSGLDALKDARLVIEAIFENLEAKQALFQQLEALLPQDTIFATNTSSVSITAIASALQYPARVVGMHFFNPAPVMKLVEVVSGLVTDPALADTIHATAAAWRKKPVHTKSTPGFIVNRVARPYYAEALRVVEENAASPALVDTLLTQGAGFPMGPFRLMDLIGNDINNAVTRSTFQAYFGDSRYRPSLLQGELVAAGLLGCKSGRGFYDYAQAPAPDAPPAAATLQGPVDITGDTQPISGLIARLQSAGAEVRITPSAAPAQLHYGRAILVRTDGRPATLRAEPSQRNLVVFDLADDDAQVSVLAIAVQDGAEHGVAADAVTLCAAMGVQACILDDVPGLVVARTLAMLANEAAEALLQGIGSAQGIDDAMRFGVNYPRGPLEWADRLGTACLLGILDGLYDSYGDDRYRASIKLRRAARSGRLFHS